VNNREQYDIRRPSVLGGLVLATVCLTIVGCGSDDGPKRYRLRGEVTYDGKPVPRGWIVLTPSKGPGASADIHNGKYETPDGFGCIGGRHTIEVVGFDGAAVPQPQDSDIPADTHPAGNQMFRPYTMTADIPAGSPEYDIHVPRQDSGS